MRNTYTEWAARFATKCEVDELTLIYFKIYFKYYLKWRKILNEYYKFLFSSGGDTFAGGTELYKTNVQVFSDGSTQWLAPATFISSCDINIRYVHRSCYKK